MKRFFIAFNGLLLIGQLAAAEVQAMENSPSEDGQFSAVPLPHKSFINNSINIKFDTSIKYLIDSTSPEASDTAMSQNTKPISSSSTRTPMLLKSTATHLACPKHTDKTKPKAGTKSHSISPKRHKKSDILPSTKSHPNVIERAKKVSPSDNHSEKKEQSEDWLSLPNHDKLRQEIGRHIKKYDAIFSTSGLHKTKLFFEELTTFTDGKILLRGEMEELQDDFLSLPTHYQNLITITDNNMAEIFKLYSHRDTNSKIMNASRPMRQIFAISVMKSEIPQFVELMRTQLPQLAKKSVEALQGAILLQQNFLTFLTKYQDLFAIIELERTGFWDMLRTFYDNSNKDIIFDSILDKLSDVISAYEQIEQDKLHDKRELAALESIDPYSKDDDVSSPLTSIGSNESHKKIRKKHLPFNYSHTS